MVIDKESVMNLERKCKVERQKANEFDTIKII